MTTRTPALAPALELAKWIAILTMVVDHAGYLLFDNFPLDRFIGRISFPLFCWVIAVRLAEDPSRAGRYLPRLALWAVLSQLPFWLAFHGGEVLWSSLNIMATLGLGVLCVYWLNQTERPTASTGSRVVGWLGIAAALVLGGKCDYGTLGVATIPLVFCVARLSREQSVRALSVIGFVTNFVIVLPYMSEGGVYLTITCGALLAGPVAALCLRFGDRVPVPRLPGWFFYAFYPVHLAVLLACVISQLPVPPDVSHVETPT